MESKMVTNRQKLGNVLSGSVRAHVGGVGARLGELLAPVLPEGESLPDLEMVQRLLVWLVEARSVVLVAADEAHLAQQLELAEPRQRVDEAAERLRSRIVEVRDMVAGHFGPEGAVKLLHIRGLTGRDPLVIKRQGRRALERLTDPALELPPLRDTASPFDPAPAVALLGPTVLALQEAIDAYTSVQQAVDATRLAKLTAMASYDEALSSVARILIGCYTLAGLPELAEKIRLFRRAAVRNGDAPAEGEEPAAEVREAAVEAAALGTEAPSASS